jgi:glycerol-3-phosphate cytidylyltransferase
MHYLNIMKNNQIRIFTAGTFDLFHNGHLNILRQAKSLGGYLIVGVSVDDLIKSYKEEPIMSLENRMEIISHIDFVDEVVMQHKLFDIEQFNELKADFFVVGDDWRDNQENKNIQWLKKNNKIKFFPYTKGLSSSIIKERIINNARSTVYPDLLK